MSAPPGSRGLRTGAKTRGSARAGSRARGSGNSASQQQQSNRATAPNIPRKNNPQPHLKPPGQQNQHRGKSWNRTDPNGEHLASAILSHAGTISKSKDQPWRNAAEQDSTSYKQRMNELYQTLKESRERERRKAIKDGFLADPDKPTSLANAITPVGTCQDMCPEFERVERIVQLMVDANEKVPSALNTESKVPCEELMVKRFRRSAAGYDEQLPSDIRPPAVLQMTLNHLFDSIIGGPEPLASTHKFVWDRTRGIRNDFSIQQVTKAEDLKIAIDCFERIARFHILSLHQLSHPTRDNGEFDHHQEREQLNNTLLSLMYYYDDSRHKLSSPNEAEFRAYCVIFEIQDQRPDLEDRAQNWPGGVLKDARVRTALKLYAAAGNTSDEQGPLRPRTAFSIAQANARGFFELVSSNSVSYIMACVAEIYFNLVRSSALESIWKAYKGKRPGAAKVEDWLLEDVTYVLGFDNPDQSRTFCEEHELEVLEREDGEEYVNLGSVTSPIMKDNNPRRRQIFSRYLVESKRLGRSFTAVINGLGVSHAQAQGLVDDSDADNASVANSESLFLNGDVEHDKPAPKSRSPSPLPPAPVHGNGVTKKLDGTASPFNTATFGLPSSKPNPFKPLQSDQVQNKEKAVPGFGTGGLAAAQAANPFSPRGPPKSNSSPNPNESPFDVNATSNPFQGNLAPKFNLFPAANDSKTQEPISDAVISAAGEQKPANVVAFGTPSTNVAADTPSTSKSGHSVQTQASAAPTFSFETSPLFLQNMPKTETIHKQDAVKDCGETNLVKQLRAVEPSAKTEHFFSTGKSPLFQSMTDGAHIEPQASSFQPARSSPPSLSPSNTSSPKQPPNNPFIRPSISKVPSAQSPIQKPNLLPEQQSQFVSGASTPSLATALNFGAPTPSDTPKSAPSQVVLQPPVSSSASVPFAIPSIPITQPHRALSSGPGLTPAVLAAKSLSSASAHLRPQPNPSRPSLPNPRPAALDRVTDGLMFDDGGLVQQYIELSIIPIMRSAIAQFEDEESWREARNHRVVLLAKKYIQKWKHNAWKCGLMRRGREQRQSLARSMQNLAKKTQKKQEQMSRSSFLDTVRSGKAKEKAAAMEVDSMPPPAIPKDKRQSLPSNLNADIDGAIQTPKRNKRKMDDTDLGNRAELQQCRASCHKRSNTVGFMGNGDSIMSAPPHRPSGVQHQRSTDISKLGDDSALTNTVMRQARHIVPEARSDTTQTDYFRLKALGIDPDTPPVPLTSKGSAISNKRNEATVVLRGNPRADPEAVSAVTQSNQRLPSQKRAPVFEDDDESFFASIRAIRSTLADSTSWFQSERESIERSITPSQASASPPPGRKETAAERRLREIKERGHTPSRSEIRLRAMGDKAFLPEGYWDGEGMGRSWLGEQQTNNKSKMVAKVPKRQNGQARHLTSGPVNHLGGLAAFVGHHSPPKNHAPGFSAFSNHKPQTATVYERGPHGTFQDLQLQQGRATSEEVIELSD